MQKNCVSCPIAQFSAGRTLLPAYNFLATMASSTYCLVAVASLKFLGNSSKYHASNYGKVVYCRLGNEWWVALMAILQDNCHPSSYFLFIYYNCCKLFALV